MYRVIKPFADLQDNEHLYGVGDTFPRPEIVVTDKRLRELSSVYNKLGAPLIEPLPAEQTDAPVEAKARRKKGGARHDDGSVRVSPQLV